MSYLVPIQASRQELIIQRSHFIACLFPINQIDDVSVCINKLKTEFKDATHFCWAYVLGKPSSATFAGLSDDGEPKGTAGKPMLNVLVHGDIGNVLIVVVRYFGGIKLGTGGLVRAYADATKLALEEAITVPYVDKTSVQVQCGYAQHPEVLHRLQLQQGEVVYVQFGIDVHLDLQIPSQLVQAFISSCEGLKDVLIHTP